MFYDTDGKTNKPTWVRVNVAEFIEHYAIEDIDDAEDLLEEEPETLERFGKLFLNMLLYSYNRDNELVELDNREQRLLMNIIKRGVDNSYANYEINRQNGLKGGRPKKEVSAECDPYPFSSR